MSFFGDLAQTAGNIFGIYSQNKDRENYYNTVAQAEAQRAQQAQAQYEYDLALRQMMASDSGGSSGGGSSGPRITSEMIDTYKGYMDKGIAELQPYADAGKAILPGATEATKNAVSGVNNLLSFYNTPEGQRMFNQSVPAYSIAFDIPKRY